MVLNLRRPRPARRGARRGSDEPTVAEPGRTGRYAGKRRQDEPRWSCRAGDVVDGGLVDLGPHHFDDRRRGGVRHRGVRTRPQQRLTGRHHRGWGRRRASGYRSVRPEGERDPSAGARRRDRRGGRPPRRLSPRSRGADRRPRRSRGRVRRPGGHGSGRARTEPCRSARRRPADPRAGPRGSPRTFPDRVRADPVRTDS